ncbi:MAG TPA: DUF1800 domain-containing protein [Xanthobacteraceae bacterium]|nr:DUF1800 domain-containing protein [Xanthobacteraceae bacterium]
MASSPDTSSLDRDTRSIIVLNRFGLGARPGDREAVARDPVGALRAEIDDPATPLMDGATLLTGRAAYRSEYLTQKALRAARERPAPVMIDGMAPLRPPESPAGPTYQAEVEARFASACAAPVGFVERLVAFWSNHFAISADKGGQVKVMAGAYEREAIRPHVLGRFQDMLDAVSKHPAMLLYLDNNVSAGPKSAFGQRSGRGLNENLAREILELHTLGVDGGYGQADVTAFANILTGWTVRSGDKAPDEALGRFAFEAGRHEPGDHEVLGRRYGQAGLAQGEGVLADIARHPATARHIARKLAAHMVSDTPPPDLVARLETRFRETDGDLRALAQVLIEAPDCWQMKAQKMRSPWDWMVAMARGAGTRPPTQLLLRSLRALGHGPWEVPAPKGYPDDTANWLSPDGLDTRLDIANEFGRGLVLDDPPARALDLLGPRLDAQTRQAVMRAESRPQAFALLVLSPPFLWR